MIGEDSTGLTASAASDRTLSDLLAILRRRSLPIILVLSAISLAGIYIAYSLPAVYESSATILIEEQEIPTGLVQSTVTSYADERIQGVRQRVMATPNVLNVISDHNLYPDLRAGGSSEEALQFFRDSFVMETNNAVVTHQDSGRTLEATISFDVRFQYDDPVLARDVARNLADLYLAENERMRSQVASQTTAFLKQEAAVKQTALLQAERDLAEFKIQESSNLPENGALNLQVLERTEREITDLDRELRGLRERRDVIEAQLTEIPRYRPTIGETGETVAGAEANLALLQQEYLRLQARYSPSHPDLIRLKREIDALSEAADPNELVLSLDAQLTYKEAELISMQERYSSSHPDVVSSQREIAALQQERDRLALIAAQSPARAPSNPAYLQATARLSAVVLEDTALRAQRAELVEKQALYEERIYTAPQVEREYRVLEREYDMMLAQYRDISAKVTEAELAETLESEQKGEKFIIIEEPRVPEAPISPNRKSLVFLGVVLAIALALGLAALLETADVTIRDGNDLQDVLGMPPLGVISFIETSADLTRRRHRKYALGISIGAVGAIVAAFLV